MKVPRLSPPQADAAVLETICENVLGVIRSGRFIGGPQVEKLECELTAYFDRPVVTVGSGTDALTAALLALPAKPPHVVVPALSFSATASAVLRAGLTPVFVDIDPETYCIDWAKVRLFDGPDVVVIPVHLYGRVTEPPPGLKATVIEDACQAFGATNETGRLAGMFGKMAALSFFPSKPLGCYGDGGAVVCDDSVTAERVRMVARHGAKTTYVSEVPGFNSRLDAVQAAVLRSKLPHVDTQHEKRLRIAQAYDRELQGLDGLTLPVFDADQAWACYVVRILDGRRNHVMWHLRDAGIDAVVQYPVPLHRQPAFDHPPKPQTLFHADRACQEVLCLPIWAGMTEEQVAVVIDAMESALSSRPAASL